MKASNLFWPITLSLLAHGVFVVFWHPLADVTFSAPSPIQVELRPAGTPQGDSRPVGGVTRSKPDIVQNAPKKSAAVQPVLTKPASPQNAESPSAASVHQRARDDAVIAPSIGNSTAGKGGTIGGVNAVGSAGAGNGKGSDSGDGQGSGAKGDGPPVKLYAPKPRYPDRSRELQEEGVVHLRLTVTRDGKPRDVTITGSSGFPRLDIAARNGVENWRFKPARQNGEPIDYPYAFTVRFNQTDP